MLKMTIDNEEVLSKGDFTIKEEMLGTSSTILNNTYPKSWEEDHDYTSKFFYPKDYSKLNIQNFNIEPEEAGKTIQINGSATLTDVDTTKESRVLRLLGQTSQTGTPTPSSPIPINVVSGDNTIGICGKNLYNGTYFNVGINTTGKTYASTEVSSTDYINIEGATNIAWNSNANTGGYSWGAFYDKDKTFISRINTTTKNASVPNGAKYVRLTFLNSFQTTLQLEVGNQATTYEPYIGKSYPINLGVENLFDKNNANVLNGYLDSNSIQPYPTNQTIYISITGGKTYTISKTIGVRAIDFAYTTITPVLGGQTLGRTATNVKTYTTIAPSNAKYLCVMVRGDADSSFTLDQILEGLFIEEGTKVNYPSTQPIELCKIGTYQDYIYKDNGSWYVHKEIGKVVLDGSESDWMTQPQTGFYRYGLNVSDATSDSSLSNTIISKSNYFNGISFNSRSTNTNETIYFVTNNSQHQFFINTQTYTTLTNFKTWLSNNKPIVYYVLATPTNTLITNTLLLSQLNDLESE